MAVFIELVTSPFQKQFNAALPSGRAGLKNVRRPLRGVEIKEDTYAYIKVIKASGEDMKLFDSSAPTGDSTEYANFLLQSVVEQRMEKQQLIETFGDSYMFFFGESPRFLDCRAIVLNSNDFNWRAEFMANYDKYLRGTKLAENGARSYLFYDDNVVEGYWVGASIQDDAQNPLFVMIQFRIFVTNSNNVSTIGSPDFPIRSAVSKLPKVNKGTGAVTTTINGAGVVDNKAARFKDLRGKISDNTDEYTLNSLITGTPMAAFSAADQARQDHYPNVQYDESLTYGIMDETSKKGTDWTDDPSKLLDKLTPTSKKKDATFNDQALNGSGPLFGLAAAKGTLL